MVRCALQLSCSVFLLSCASLGHSAAPFSWKLPWQVGDKIEIVRSEEAGITPAAFNLEKEGVLPAFGWRSRIAFHAIVTATDGDRLRLELVVAEAQRDGSWGAFKSSSLYARGRGQRDGLTGEPEESEMEYQRTYICTVDKNGIMKHWDDRLDAMACLHGLGGEFYNMFTALLLEVPQGILPAGHSWTVDTAVNLAHCDQVPFRLACRLEQGRSLSGEAGHCIVSEASLLDRAPDYLGPAGRKIGSGCWWMSPDQRRIEGSLALDLVRDGTSIVRWRDRIEVRHLKE